MNKTQSKVPESEFDETEKDAVDEVSCQFNFYSLNNILYILDSDYKE